MQCWLSTMLDHGGGPTLPNSRRSVRGSGIQPQACAAPTLQGQCVVPAGVLKPCLATSVLLGVRLRLSVESQENCQPGKIRPGSLNLICCPVPELQYPTAHDSSQVCFDAGNPGMIKELFLSMYLPERGTGVILPQQVVSSVFRHCIMCSCDCRKAISAGSCSGATVAGFPSVGRPAV